MSLEQIGNPICCDHLISVERAAAAELHQCVCGQLFDECAAGRTAVILQTPAPA